MADPSDGGPEDLDVETRLNFASRLCALEYFACHVLSATMPAALHEALDIDGMHRRMLDELSPKAAATVSEAYSEMAMSELHYAIRRLISLQREMLGMPRRLRP